MSNLSSHDRHTLDNYSGMSVGQIFRRARTDLGYNILDIATHLNIASTHLDAIEADDINSLPPKVYAVGFVRAYADVLSLDSEKMAYLFKVQFYGKNQTDQQKFMARPEGKTVSLHDTLAQKDNIIPALLSALFIIVIVSAALIFFVVWLVTPSDKTGEITVPEVPAELLKEEAAPIAEVAPEMPEQTEAAETQAEPEVQAAAAPIALAVEPDEGGTAYGADPYEAVLALKMTDKSWLEIRDLVSGKVILTRTLNKGDVFYAKEGEDILLTTGNAGGVEVFLDGKSLGVLGKNAEVLRSRPFSIQSLRLQNSAPAQ